MTFIHNIIIYGLTDIVRQNMATNIARTQKNKFTIINVYDRFPDVDPNGNYIFIGKCLNVIPIEVQQDSIILCASLVRL